MAAGGTTLVDLAVRCDQDGIGCVQCGYFRAVLTVPRGDDCFLHRLSPLHCTISRRRFLLSERWRDNQDERSTGGQ